MTDTVPAVSRNTASASSPAAGAGSTSAAAGAIMTFCARELMQLGRYDLAARIAQLVVAENERSPDAHSLVADPLDELGRWPEALNLRTGEPVGTGRSLAPVSLFRRLNVLLHSTEFEHVYRFAEAGGFASAGEKQSR